jgi:thioredoxin reductase
VTGDLGGKTNYMMEFPEMESHQLITGKEIVNKFKQELEYLNFARHMETVNKVVRKDDFFIVQTSGGGELETKAAIVATGARQQWLDVPGEQEFYGRGLGYSAISYAPFLIDKKALVVGKGTLALRSTAELATVAKHVHLIGPSGDILASPLGKKLRTSMNVTILENYQVTQVTGNGFCNGVVAKSPEGKEEKIRSDGAFVELALIPNSELVADLVERDITGRIKVDCQGRTNVPGIFAAGDVTTSTEQVLVAVGEGAKAALSAFEYLLPIL